jgi:protein tyrosine/serine phosphatase
MIQRLREITKGLYRGSAPSPQDVVQLKEQLGINKIVSLDKAAGDRIDRTCKLLGIEHIKLYLDEKPSSLRRLFEYNLKKLLIDGGPTYLHCHFGKDRTGLVTALFKCKYMGESPQRAIEEAKALGFGVGVDPHIVRLYEEIIKACKSSKDENAADIVSNEREYIGDNRDTYLDESRQDSFAPYLDHTKQNPADALYTYINDQSPTRQNYDPDRPITPYDQEKTDVVPMVGEFDNDAGQRGFGPTENYGGFFSEIGH